ncbi:MAG: DUF4123 domain-containing protein [Pseudoalteromonas distincta]
MTFTRHSELPLIPGPVYLLAELHPGLMELIYQNEPDPSPEYLFDHTPFSSLREQGPLLLSLSAQGGLLESLRQDPKKVQGLLLASHSPTEELLRHLRSILEVGFDQQRRAIMRYYDPFVASYFWPAISETELNRWMGPANEMYWFGGSWKDMVEQTMAWHALQPRQRSALTHRQSQFILSESQQQALVRQSLEQFAFNWLQRHPAEPFDQLFDRIQTGLAAGQDTESALSDWLMEDMSPRMEHRV